MFSVTSEAAASVSFQNAPSKSARPDPSQLNDSFGAMVDSSIPADTGNDRVAPAAPQPPASQRRADDTAAGADNTRSREASADRAAQNASDDRNASAQQASDANAAANADADASAAAAQRSKAKSGDHERRRAKTSDKPSSDKASATDQAGYGAAGRAVRDDAEPGRGCDHGRHRIDGCSGRTAGNRQRHGAAGHRSGGHRGQHRPGPRRRRAGGCRRRRSRSMSIPPPQPLPPRRPLPRTPPGRRRERPLLKPRQSHPSPRPQSSRSPRPRRRTKD